MKTAETDGIHLVDGKYAIDDLVDFGQLRRIFERFTEATGFTIGFLDHPGLNILIATGWRDICIKFHRGRPESEAVCLQSNRKLLDRLDEPGKVVVESCGHGLVDCATPIFVKGKHIASLAIGQLLLNEPDCELFKQQAQRFGFDEEAYLQAVAEIPVVTEDRLKNATALLGEIALVVSQIGYANLIVKEETANLVGEIAERSRAEEALQETQRRLKDIIDFLPDATLVIDRDGKVIAWNRAIESMTRVKKEAMLGRGNYEYALPFYGNRIPILIDLALHPEKELQIMKYMAIQRVGDILFGEAFIPGQSGSGIHLSATASVLHDSAGEIVAAIECIRDNTERKSLEERLHRAEKMEGLGRLAGGVAHDLNNVLGVLVGHAELLAEKVPSESPLQRHAVNILQSSLKGAAIIQDLLTLARRGVTVAEAVDLNGVIFDYLKAPEFEKLTSYHPNVAIRTELAEGLPNIKGSPVHLSKTIMNLVSNAAEAITDRGEVTIRTENRYLDRPIRGYDEIQEGDYVVLTVADNGKGISSQDMGKIFEPFYTKKVMGRSGTGLGLAVVWGTVKDHNGYIDVQSERAVGTTFTLYFPATREKVARAEETVSPSVYMGRGEFILVVDDMTQQRELAASMLERLGYRVEAVGSGEKAVEYIRNRSADLVVLDMIMDPGIDGLETYRRILEIHPGQRAVIVSGYAETDRVRKAQKIGAGSFVRKPYVLEKLGLAIRRELDGLRP